MKRFSVLLLTLLVSIQAFANAPVIWNGDNAKWLPAGLNAEGILTVDSSGVMYRATEITADVTGNLTGNADTATALAADPTDCSANEYAATIDSSGNLTCAKVSLAQGVVDNLPVTNLGAGVNANSSTFWRGDGSWQSIDSSATPGGSDTELQYNNAGTFDGIANFTFDGTDLSIASGTDLIPNGSGTRSVKIGSGTTASGTNSIAIGDGASSSVTNGIAIGRNATALNNIRGVAIGENASAGTFGDSATAIGDNANAQSANSIAIGQAALTNGSDSLAIGSSSATSGADAIALGRGASAGANQFAVGSVDAPITSVFVGEGASSASPQDLTVSGTTASGTDVAAGDTYYSVARSTGAADPGRIIWQISTADTSSSTAQTLVDRLILDDALQYQIIDTPAAPPNGYVSVYPKSDGFLYQQDHLGTETALGFTTLNESRGGTGESTYTSGQVLIGDSGGLSTAFLTAGENVTIISGDGSITISADSSGGGSITADSSANVQSLYGGVVNTEFIRIAAACSGTCTTLDRSGGFLSCSQNSTGNYTCTFDGSPFTIAPTCTCTSADDQIVCSVNDASTSTVDVIERSVFGLNEDREFNLICQGKNN